MGENSGRRYPSSSENLLDRVRYTPSAPLPSTAAAATPQTLPRPVLCSQNSDTDPTAERVPSGKAASPTSAEPSATSQSALQREIYPYTYPKNGFCFIINNKRFQINNLHDREGSEIDVVDLKELFLDMKFTVHCENDLTKSKMHEAFQQLTTTDLDKYSSLVVCIMSHGKGGNVFGTDGGDIGYQDILKHFTRVLKGKPKLFLVQACRDRRDLQRDGHGNFARDADPDLKPERPDPEERDIVVAFACTDSNSAYRYPVMGSPYIRHFVRAVRAANGCEHLLDILTDVTNAVSKELPEHCKQTPCYYSTLIKHWYLPPCNKEPSSAPACRAIRPTPPPRDLMHSAASH